MTLTPLLLALAASNPSSLGVLPFHGVSGDTLRGVVIEAASCYQEVPPSGAIPITVMIENRTDQDRTWYAETKSASDYSDANKTRQRFEIDVPAKSTLKRQLLAPLPPTTSSMSSMWHSVDFTIDGYGVVGRNGYVSSRTPAIGDLRLTVLVAGDVARQKAEVKNIRGKEVHYLHGMPECFPTNVRGYVGIDAVWITSAELGRLPPEARLALEEHVFLGGQLGVVLPEGAGALSLPLSFMAGEASSTTYGLGSVVVLMEAEGDVPMNLVKDALLKIDSRFAKLHHDGDVVKAYPQIEVERAMMLVLLILFAIVIGPVNLFVVARRKHRARLVWTTPALSVGASFLLAGAILIEDGIGGHGVRYSVTLLEPIQHAEHTLQVQASRTGLLLFPRLKTPPDAYLDYLPTSVEQTGSYRVDEDGYRGDWFRTRRTQAHWLYERRPSRARVERVGAGDVPVLSSTIDAGLATLFYVDANGAVWTGTDITPGARVTLEPSSADAFETWRIERLVGSHPILHPAMTRRKGWFYASAKDAGTNILPTLGAVDWEDRGSLFAGPVVAEGER